MLNQLTPVLYQELHRLAQSFFRRQKPGHTLQPTALVHEAYLKLAGQTQLSFQSRAQFLGLAAMVMRQILVDHARTRKAAKRNADAPSVTLHEDVAAGPARTADVVALDDALTELSRLDPRKAKLIELRFFGGLTGSEMAEVAGISTATVTRELRMAEAWLHREISSPPPA